MVDVRRATRPFTRAGEPAADGFPPEPSAATHNGPRDGREGVAYSPASSTLFRAADAALIIVLAVTTGGIVGLTAAALALMVGL